MESKQTLTAHTQMNNLDQRGKIIAEYIWIDGSLTMRAKARTLDAKITHVDQLPEWNFDGSSCYMAPTENSEVIMKPVAFFPDPFRGGDNILVMCETFVWEDTTYKNLVPAKTNFRCQAKVIFDECLEEKPWYEFLGFSLVSINEFLFRVLIISIISYMIRIGLRLCKILFIFV